MRPLCALFICLLAAAWTACTPDKPPVSSVVVPPNRPSSNSTPSRATESEGQIPRQEHGTPQPRLPAVKLWVGTNTVSAEVAHTVSQIMTGMMWRTNMEEMEGMLFVFSQPQQVSFWMRNTLIPLSCAYINPDGTILELHDMKPRDETPIPSGSDQVQFVLEMKQGWFDRHGVKPGMLISTEAGPLRNAFFRR